MNPSLYEGALVLSERGLPRRLALRPEGLRGDEAVLVLVSVPLGARIDGVAVEVAEGELLVDEAGELVLGDEGVRLGLGPPHVAADLVVEVVVPGLRARGEPVALLVDRDQARLGRDGPPVASDVNGRRVDQVDAVPLVLLVLAVGFRVAHLK